MVVVCPVVVVGVFVTSSICAEPSGDFRINRCDLRVCVWFFSVGDLPRFNDWS